MRFTDYSPMKEMLKEAMSLVGRQDDELVLDSGVQMDWWFLVWYRSITSL